MSLDRGTDRSSQALAVMVATIIGAVLAVPGAIVGLLQLIDDGSAGEPGDVGTPTTTSSTFAPTTSQTPPPPTTIPTVGLSDTTVLDPLGDARLSTGIPEEALSEDPLSAPESSAGVPTETIPDPLPPP
jgi:hypothetical protein